ncbi:Inter-alpha-trypsin inhibitor heavy chain [Heracleum sosnowskyi]|uniref:Inter-alpha-trypsin inhibitor heavy chain n=1 Tax=Heracleum sosnowskyi TaxID=360622 RepID=A0AAD8J5J9_9APIA|nr:Inter-alpha-trypsin inhibitor heavy chain [Heracleum sosnowskyi]
MFSSTWNTIPIIFLITDGAVEDERDICDIMESHMTNSRSLCPRIHTFGIGSFCNHYFLRMLAEIGRGRYDAAYDVDSIEIQMKSFFRKALSTTVLANIRIGNVDSLDELEVYPSRVPDLLFESPVIIFGRYCGKFPSSPKIEGILPDTSNFTIDLKLQEAKDIPISEVLAKHQIESYTAESWFSNNIELEKKIAKLSVHNSVITEYTCMILLEEGPEHAKTVSAGIKKKEQLCAELDHQKIMLLPKSGFGFGSASATAANTRPGRDEHKLPGRVIRHVYQGSL